MPIGLHPDSDKRPILPAGRYGTGGEAEATSISARKVPGENSTGYFVDVNVQVDHPTQGRIFIHTQPFGPFNTQMGEGAGSMAKAVMSGLGLNPAQVQFADEPDDKGNHALIGPNPCPCKVVVDVNLDTYKNKQGEQVERNSIKGLGRLA